MKIVSTLQSGLAVMAIVFAILEFVFGGESLRHFSTFNFKSITGVYIKSLNSKLNFNMQGTDLNAEEQDKALKAYKTIKLKE